MSLLTFVRTNGDFVCTEQCRLYLSLAVTIRKFCAARRISINQHGGRFHSVLNSKSCFVYNYLLTWLYRAFRAANTLRAKPMYRPRKTQALPHFW
jgi:hypothetical protein